MKQEQAFDRRTVLAAGSAGILASGVAPLMGQAPAPPKLKKAVKLYMVKVSGTLLDKFKLLKELGFDGIELDSPGGAVAEEVRKCVEETGLVVPGVVDSVHWNKTLSAADPAVREQGLAALKEALHASKAYGGTSVLLVPGVVNKQVSYQECWDRSVAEIKKVTPLAEELGIDILIENVWNEFLTDPKEMARFIDDCGSSRVGAHFDTGNTIRYSPSHEWIPILGQRIKKLDIKDFSKTTAKGFGAKLLEGDVDWKQVMAELRKIGYAGWGTAEIAAGDREWLTDVAARMDRIFAA